MSRYKFWRDYYAESIKPLLILHERRDLTEAAGVRLGEQIAKAVPHIVSELDKARAEIAELKAGNDPAQQEAFAMALRQAQEIDALRSRLAAAEAAIRAITWLDDIQVVYRCGLKSDAMIPDDNQAAVRAAHESKPADNG